MTRELTLGFSPCPNDTFMFYPLVHGLVDTAGLTFRERLEDVETLNRLALAGELDVTKVSYHALGHIRDRYALLRSGSALGRGCGPLLVAREEFDPADLRGRQAIVFPCGNIIQDDAVHAAIEERKPRPAAIEVS